MLGRHLRRGNFDLQPTLATNCLQLALWDTGLCPLLKLGAIGAQHYRHHYQCCVTIATWIPWQQEQCVSIPKVYLLHLGNVISGTEPSRGWGQKLFPLKPIWVSWGLGSHMRRPGKYSLSKWKYYVFMVSRDVGDYTHLKKPSHPIETNSHRPLTLSLPGLEMNFKFSNFISHAHNFQYYEKQWRSKYLHILLCSRLAHFLSINQGNNTKWFILFLWKFQCSFDLFHSRLLLVWVVRSALA